MSNFVQAEFSVALTADDYIDVWRYSRKRLVRVFSVPRRILPLKTVLATIRELYPDARVGTYSFNADNQPR